MLGRRTRPAAPTKTQGGDTMKKRTIGLLVVMALVIASFAACGDSSTTPTSTNTPTPTKAAATNTPTPTEAAAAEELPTAKYHWGFEGDDAGIVSVVQATKTEEDTANTDFGGTYSVVESDTYTDDGIIYSTAPLYADGPVGKCIYLNGKFGYKLADFEGVANDTYTISYWLNADRLSTYGPVVQLGHNMCMNTHVSWINFTQTEWGSSSAKIFPVVWNRNQDDNGGNTESDGCWPWFYANDDSIHGKKEWVLVTLVVNGQVYQYGEGDAALDQVNATYYINGQEVFDSQMSAYGGMATGILDPSFDNDIMLGINWWDSVYKGYIDELYVFDTALTAGQVQALYQQGDASVKSEAPAAEQVGTSDATPTPVVEVEETVNFCLTVDNSHIVLDGTTIGAEDNTSAFFTAFTDIFPVAAGETVSKTVKVYNGVENWNNFCVVLQNVPTGHSATDTPGYREYCVVRTDNYGWGSGYAADTKTAKVSWLEGVEGDDAVNAAWAAWKAAINEADVTVSVTNNTDTIAVKIEFTGADGVTYTIEYDGLSTAVPVEE